MNTHPGNINTIFRGYSQLLFAFLQETQALFHIQISVSSAQSRFTFSLNIHVWYIVKTL